MSEKKLLELAETLNTLALRSVGRGDAVLAVYQLAVAENARRLARERKETEPAPYA